MMIFLYGGNNVLAKKNWYVLLLLNMHQYIDSFRLFSVEVNNWR
jgi:hypothetical protein